MDEELKAEKAAQVSPPTRDQSLDLLTRKTRGVKSVLRVLDKVGENKDQFWVIEQAAMILARERGITPDMIPDPPSIPEALKARARALATEGAVRVESEGNDDGR